MQGGTILFIRYKLTLYLDTVDHLYLVQVQGDLWKRQQRTLPGHPAHHSLRRGGDQPQQQQVRGGQQEPDEQRQLRHDGFERRGSGGGGEAGGGGDGGSKPVEEWVFCY